MKVVSKPVDVIASFSKEGIPTPIRFRYQDLDDQVVVVRIDGILFREIEKFAGNQMIVFRCESIISGISRTYEIKYELATCKWILFKG